METYDSFHFFAFLIIDVKLFRSVFPVPAGGRTSFDLEFSRKTASGAVELWCIGYEDVSAGCLKRSRAPLEFMKTLPLQHPYGFPCAVKCVLTDEEAHDY